jgi:DmsE family decaheme c-type cytochrome
MTSKHGGLMLGLTLAAAGVLAVAASARAQEDCATCHEDKAKAFARTGHGRYFKADKTYEAANCLTCHRGAEDHAASGGEKKPPSLKRGPEANTSCLLCHAANPRHAHWQGSPHQLAGVACATCHDPHQPPKGTPEQTRTLPGPTETTKKCLECHGTVRGALHQRSAHPMRDGQMDCASCHDPHGTTGEKLLRLGSTNETCYSCHQNMRGPFLWEHAPVREDCLTCHKPHGSNYPQLLQARVTQLCQSCHQQGRHQTMPGLPTALWVGNRACVNCHMNIHGSNHPSGPLFQR